MPSINHHVHSVKYCTRVRLRVERLKRLLVETNEPIKKISADTGFGTTVNMHTMFKRHTGMTPAEHRKKHGPRPQLESNHHFELDSGFPISNTTRRS
jgi:transcriptional regulator GlxA family with amidase domain